MSRIEEKTAKKHPLVEVSVLRSARTAAAETSGSAIQVCVLFLHDRHLDAFRAIMHLPGPPTVAQRADPPGRTSVINGNGSLRAFALTSTRENLECPIKPLSVPTKR